MVEEYRANERKITLRSGGTLTLSCTDLFKMSKVDRDFVLGILEQLEMYEAVAMATEQEETSK